MVTEKNNQKLNSHLKNVKIMKAQNNTFAIGQEVVRTSGGYAVGRTGPIVAIDTEKNRAQVAWVGEVKTWVSFTALALTSTPYHIVDYKYILGAGPVEPVTEAAPVAEDTTTEPDSRGYSLDRPFVLNEVLPAAPVEAAQDGDLVNMAAFTVSEKSVEELTAELAQAVEVEAAPVKKEKKAKATPAPVTETPAVDAPATEAAPVLSKKEKRAARRAARKLAQGVTPREPKTAGPTIRKVKKSIMKKIESIARVAKTSNMTGVASITFANIDQAMWDTITASIVEYPAHLDVSGVTLAVTDKFALTLILK